MRAKLANLNHSAVPFFKPHHRQFLPVLFIIYSTSCLTAYKIKSRLVIRVRGLSFPAVIFVANSVPSVDHVNIQLVHNLLIDGQF